MGKRAIDRMKKKPRQCKKIFANNTTNKGLISKYTNTSHTIQYQISKWLDTNKMDRRPKQNIFPWRHTDGHQVHAKCSISLGILDICK